MNEIDAYKQFSNILNSLQPYSIDLSLNRIKEFLNKIGDPQNGFKSILIGGTNGKGTLCQFLTDAFLDAGFNVGTYTSPHLIQINERFKINNKPVSYSILLDYAQYLQKKQNGRHLTYFEFLTALAFLIFKDMNVEIAVLEVGMGGEFDATNTVNPILSIITRISLDHTEHLGKTHKEIAKTKSKIIKNIGVIGKNNKTVIETIKQNSNKTLYFADKTYANKAKRTKTQMQGTVSKENLSTALLSIDVLNKHYMFNLKYESLRNSFWPGRFEIIKTNGKTIILDGAHNKNAAAKLAMDLKKIKEDKLLIFSALKQKDWKNSLKILLPHFKSVILTSIAQHGLSEDADIMKEFIKNKNSTEVCGNMNQALFSSMKHLETTIVVTGSLYLIGQAKACRIYDDFLP